MLIYRSADGSIKIDVRMGEETVWLTQDQMAALFGKAKSTINEHLKNIFSEGELVADSVIRNFRTTAADGKGYDTNYYNLDVIISVGYRVKSHRRKTGVGATKEMVYLLNIARKNIDKFGQQLGQISLQINSSY